MEGTFTTTAGDVTLAREKWSVKAADGRERLTATGEILEAPARRWELSATTTAKGLLESLELQVTSPPSEVTTVALRSHGERVFITRIPPGGVPDRIETAFSPGSLVVGPSLALLAQLAVHAPVQAGMGRRSLFVRVGERDLAVRLEDGIILHGRRFRGAAADGREGWIRPLEIRTAADAAREEVVINFDSDGRVVRAVWPHAIPAREAQVSKP